MFNWITNRMSCYDVNDIQSLNQMTHDVSKDKSSKIIHTGVYMYVTKNLIYLQFLWEWDRAIHVLNF